jgi:hypothetical protein
VPEPDEERSGAWHRHRRGLDPLVTWLTRHRVPRWSVATIVVLGLFGAISGFLGTPISPPAP